MDEMEIEGMEKKAKVPKLRFPGFTGEWEERKLGDLSEKVTEKNIHNVYTETLTNSAENGIISQRDFFDKDISNNANLDGYYVVKNDAFVYNPRISTTAPVGPIKRNKLGRTGVMSPLYYIFQTHDIDNTFLETYFSTRYWHQFMKLNGDSGARADRFAIKDAVLKEMPIPYPANEEQQCIGVFFKQVDNIIILHQRKLAHLQAKKKCLLQKMFPKKGERVPEIRFPGFEGDWEQRKFGKLVLIERGGSPRPINEYMTDKADGLNWVKISDAPSQGNYIIQTAEKIKPSGLSKTREVHPGDLILSNSMSFGRPYIMGIHGCIHDGWLLIRDINKSFDLKYLCCMLGTEQMLSQYVAMAAGSAVNNLNKDLVGNTVIKYPQKEEQQKIGEFFKSLDNLINLHQRKLIHLQTQKKALLQQMFV